MKKPNGKYIANVRFPDQEGYPRLRLLACLKGETLGRTIVLLTDLHLKRHHVR